MSGNFISSDSEFSIGNIQVSPKRNLLVVHQAEMSLEPRVMDVLCYLSQNAPNVVSRDELIENIWQIEYGGDESLTRAISILRKTFKSAGIEEALIETIPKRGYRLTASPQTIVVADSKQVSVNKPSKANQKGPYRIILLGLMFVGTAIGSIYFFNKAATQSSNKNDIDDLEIMTETAISVCDGKENVKSVDLNEGIVCKDSNSNPPTLNELDKSRYKDMARMNDPSTYMEGLDQLESHAKTFEDWQLLAELSYNKDTNRAIKATREALKLNPSDFFIQSLQSQVLSIAGRNIEALDSIEKLKNIAKTENEKFIAGYTFINIAMQLEERGLVKSASSEFSDILVSIETNLPSDLDVNPVSDREVQAHPYWMLASGLQALSGANQQLGDKKASLASLEQSDRYFKLLIPIMKGEAEFAPYYRLVQNNGARASILKDLTNYDAALKAHQENLLLYFDLRDIDYKSVGIRFPNTWFAMGELYILKNDQENAKLMFGNAEAEYKSLLDKSPNHTEALEGLEKSKTQLEEISKKSKSGNQP